MWIIRNRKVTLRSFLFTTAGSFTNPKECVSLPRIEPATYYLIYKAANYFTIEPTNGSPDQ